MQNSALEQRVMSDCWFVCLLLASQHPAFDYLQAVTSKNGRKSLVHSNT